MVAIEFSEMLKDNRESWSKVFSYPEELALVVDKNKCLKGMVFFGVRKLLTSFLGLSCVTAMGWGQIGMEINPSWPFFFSVLSLKQKKQLRLTRVNIWLHKSPNCLAFKWNQHIDNHWSWKGLLFHKGKARVFDTETSLQINEFHTLPSYQEVVKEGPTS